MQAALGEDQDSWIVRGSPGQGQWAYVPWISVFDPAITTTATHGYYVVYLFAADMSRVYLSLNQGTTAVRNDFGTATGDELERRAHIMRTRLRDRDPKFTEAPIELRSMGQLEETMKPAMRLALHIVLMSYLGTRCSRMTSTRCYRSTAGCPSTADLRRLRNSRWQRKKPASQPSMSNADLPTIAASSEIQRPVEKRSASMAATSGMRLRL